MRLVLQSRAVDKTGERPSCLPSRVLGVLPGLTKRLDEWAARWSKEPATELSHTSAAGTEGTSHTPPDVGMPRNDDLGRNSLIHRDYGLCFLAERDSNVRGASDWLLVRRIWQHIKISSAGRGRIDGFLK